MKRLALDLGDVWTGTALSDALGITSTPYETVDTQNLLSFLESTIKKHTIKEVIIGYPLTLRGTESIQTKKIIQEKEKLEKKFPEVKFTLWDERRTSAQAASLKKATSKKEKLQSHSIAAALILQTYLEHLRF